MAYKEYTHLNATAYTPQLRKPKKINIHHWGDDGQTIQGAMAWHTRPNANTSAHYFAAAGVVYCLVDPDYIAWANGDWQANVEGISIECRPEMSAGDFETVAELIADIRKTYGNLPLTKHSDFYATACPGRWANQLGALDRRAREIQSGKKTTVKAATVASKKTETPEEKQAGAFWRFRNDALEPVRDAYRILRDIDAKLDILIKVLVK